MEVKIGFFRKLKKAMFNIEEYNKFAQEKTSKTISYFLKLIILGVIIITVLTTYQTYQISKSIMEKFKKEVPNFKIEDGILTVENDEKYNYVDENNNLEVIVEPKADKIEEVKHEETVAFLKDKIAIKSFGVSHEIPYTTLINEKIEKSDLDNILTNKNLKTVYIALGGTLLFSNFLMYTLIILMDIILLSAVGYIMNILARTNLKYQDIIKMSVYATTLPFILLIIYQSVTLFVDFTIQYFNIAYRAISYIYLITAIFMIKSDTLKNQQLVGKINTEKKDNKDVIDTEEDIEKDTEKPDEKKEKDDKEKPDGEPEGSKA